MPADALLNLALLQVRTWLILAGWAGVGVLVLLILIVEWDRRH